MKNVAILGGSFNPVTRAHIQIAKYVFDHVDFNEVWLMPCYNHLQKSGLIDFRHRFNMCEIACKEFSYMVVSNFEASHEMDGSVYSLMEKLKKENEDTEFSYIIGMDQANNFKTWKNWEKLKDTTRFIVFPRIGIFADPEVTWYYNSPHIYIANTNGGYFPIMDISSTQVRELLKFYHYDEHGLQNLAVGPMLDINVLQYIRENKLYNQLPDD